MMVGGLNSGLVGLYVKGMFQEKDSFQRGRSQDKVTQAYNQVFMNKECSAFEYRVDLKA